MTAADKRPYIRAVKPSGYDQRCTFCERHAVTTVELGSKNPIQTEIFFHLCKSHARYLYKLIKLTVE